MDKQYEYLEELIRIAERSAKDEKLECTNEIQNVDKASDKFFRYETYSSSTPGQPANHLSD
jgi:hypothetical protein